MQIALGVRGLCTTGVSLWFLEITLYKGQHSGGSTLRGQLNVRAGSACISGIESTM